MFQKLAPIKLKRIGQSGSRLPTYLSYADGFRRICSGVVPGTIQPTAASVRECHSRGKTMKQLKSVVALAMSLCMLFPTSLFASSHREAPITALDRTADVTDWYAFVSYNDPTKVTFILNVDPLLEPANGPNYFPFDPNVLYEMHVDNNQDGLDDVTIQFRFKTQIGQPTLFTGFVGGIAGFPQITSLSGAGSEGFSLRQTYTVTMVKNGQS